MIVPGLISVTFRDRSIEEIAGLAWAAGLQAVEWGADVHVAAGDDAAADRARRASEDHGLVITGYGSYHFAGDDSTDGFRPVLDTALRLGAPSIRVWAGRRGSADADDDHRTRVVDGIAAVVEEAGAAGVQVGLEFHGGTLTDTPEAAAALCETTGARSHWQPPVGIDDAAALAGLRTVRPHLAALHVFAWSADARRLPLAARRDLWRAALAETARQPGDRPALLEFVADDDPANMKVDAATLLELIAETSARPDTEDTTACTP